MERASPSDAVCKGQLQGQVTMKIYKRVWSSTYWTLLTSICGAAAAVGPLSYYLALFLVAAAAAAFYGQRPLEAPSAATPSTPRPGLPGTALKAGAALSGAAATLALSPWLFLALALPAALTCPRVVCAVLARLSSPRPPNPAAPPDGVSSGARRAPPRPLPATHQDGADVEALEVRVDAVYLECLSTSELCRAWRESFVRLQRAATSDRRARIVASRGRYLDELRRRDPDGVDEWLCRGPRAASGPDKYMRQ